MLSSCCHHPHHNPLSQYHHAAILFSMILPSSYCWPVPSILNVRCSVFSRPTYSFCLSSDISIRYKRYQVSFSSWCNHTHHSIILTSCLRGDIWDSNVWINNAGELSVTKLDIKPHININPINNQVRKRYQVATCSMMIYVLLHLLEQGLSRSKLNNTQAGIVFEKQNILTHKRFHFGSILAYVFHDFLDRN